MRQAAMILLGVAALSGCGEITLSAVTTPPPGAIAELDDEDRAVRLSPGAAIAFECIHTMDGPCGSGQLESGDERIAIGRPAHSDGLLGRGAYPSDYQVESGAQQRSLFVIVGLASGSTTLELTTERGDVSLDLDVE